MAYQNNQIAVYKTDKKLVELLDKLAPADLEHYAHIHAGGEQNEDGTRRRSNIGVRLLDYSEGKGEACKRAEANLSPDELQFIFSKAASGSREFEFHTEKIFGSPDENGRSTVVKFTVKRAETGSDGKPRNYPWYIEIENGTGVPKKTATGGTYCAGGTFVSTVKVFANLKDLDFFKLFNAANRYLLVWEQFYGCGLLNAREEAN